MGVKTKAHIRYKNEAGQIVPGVTTALNILNKPALPRWANNLGLRGIDMTKYVDELASIGTLAHYFIQCDLTGEQPDTSEYSASDIDRAENALLSYYEWRKGKTIEPILIETPLVSEIYGYGGTLDIYANMDDVLTLIDVKTSKGIFPEHRYQIAALKVLLEEHDYPVEAAGILRVGRDEDEGFEYHHVKNLEKCFELFEHCLAIYKLQKEVGK